MQRFPEPLIAETKILHDVNDGQLGVQNPNNHEPLAQTAPEEYDSRLALMSSPPLNIADELYQIQEYVNVIGTRVQYLQGLIEHERSIVAHATDIKRGLKNAHRELEKFQFETCRGLGDEVEGLVRDATRLAWQSYRSMVALEERLRGLEGDQFPILVQHWTSNEEENNIFKKTKGNQEGQGVYIPTGAQKSPTVAVRTKGRPQTPLNFVRQIERGAEPYDPMDAMSHALAAGQRIRDALPDAEQDTTSILQPAPHLLAPKAHSPPAIHSLLEDINPSVFPQPRSSVKLRIQHEESSKVLTLNDPDKVRRGSCNGFTITDMIMCGIDDHRFVLPYFHHIKHHEVRALKDWLCERNFVERTGSLSRMEKVLHCIQLLQTGCRYESLAVIFSRSPLQVKASCYEVMQGLLRLHAHSVSMNEASHHVVQMYMPLWGLWSKYSVAKEKAVLYYGFHLIEIAKVLGALNLYIGRWRMQGSFAVDGPAFCWGGVFMLERKSTKAVDNFYRGKDGSEEPGDDDDDDGTSTIRPTAAMASQRFEID